MNPLFNLIAKNPVSQSIEKAEAGLHARDDTLHPSAASPMRFEIVKESIKRGRDVPSGLPVPIIIHTMFGVRKALSSLKDNPVAPKTLADAGLLSEIEAAARKLGASSVGYTKVPAQWVFQGKAVMFDNAIVLTMEMDPKGIDSAPSLACQRTVFATYRDLGRIANKLAGLLRSRGFGAHAGHPLDGQALYPPLAQMAGLGWLGMNGLIVTPEHGPRVRLAAVFTSIDNLPVCPHNEHSWVSVFCQTCRVCTSKCPPKALYEKPIDHGTGQLTYVDNNLCFPYFYDYYGCSICIKVCPFNHVPYHTLLNKYNKRSRPGMTVAGYPGAMDTNQKCI